MSIRKKILIERGSQNISSQKKKLKLVLVVLFVFTALMLVIINIELPLPENERGSKEIQGKITSCEMQKIGRGLTAQLYVGIQLDNNKSRLLKLNAPLSMREKYQLICDKRMNVKATYHANRLLIRPEVTYEIDLLTILDKY